MDRAAGPNEDCLLERSWFGAISNNLWSQEQLREIGPQVLFLMEIKLNSRRMENVRRKCGFLYGLDVDAVGSRGGLSLCWKQDCSVSLRSYSQNHVDVDILKAHYVGGLSVSTVTPRSDSVFILGICFVIWVKIKACLGLWLVIFMRLYFLLKNNEVICDTRGIWKSSVMFYTIVILVTWGLLVGSSLEREADQLRLIFGND